MIRPNQQPHSDQSQAEEDNELPSQHSHPPSSDSDAEDLDDHAHQDYQPIPELDRYEEKGIDDQYYSINPEERIAAEKELRWRDQENSPDALDPLELFFDQDKQDEEFTTKRHQFYDVIEDDEEQAFDYIDAEETRGPFEVWVAQSTTRTYIKRKLTKFINCFREAGELIYYQKLKKMCLNNEESLVIQYEHLKGFSDKLAEWVAIHPSLVLPELSAALYSFACKLYPSYKSIVGEAYLKIAKLPVSDKIRTLSYNILSQLIKVQGVVTSASAVYSQLRRVYYVCVRCGYLKGPFFCNQTVTVKLGSCHSCQGNGCFKIHHSRSLYRNYQIITIQQAPSAVAAGRIPRSKEAILVGDSIDRVKPGDEVEVTGIFTTRFQSMLNIKQGFPVFHTYIEVNYIETVDSLTQYMKINQNHFEQFPKQPNFALKFFNTIAPSIYGHRKVKKALTLALFGGVEKNNTKNMHRTRGDINVLLMGDPGIAKSQFLKSLQKIFGRCIYTTGKGASAVGLTAAVRQDPTSHEWRLQAGALVLADRGLCLIDEFDKMSEQDRTSIHQAMQQQTISISKAGIVATLNARCSVIAAANPVGGIYSEQVSFRDNIDLSQPILSRFDLLTVMKDRPDPQNDGRMASFIINQHIKNHPYRQIYQTEQTAEEDAKQEKLLDQDVETATLEQPTEFIKEYIRYARHKYRPKFSEKSALLIKQFYAKLREYSEKCGGLSIVARHLESMVRIAEAHAKMHLRKETNQQDARVAISTMLRSFMDTQRHSTAESIKKAFKYDFMVYD